MNPLSFPRPPIVAAFLLASGVVATSAEASPIVDQSFVPPVQNIGGQINRQPLCQGACSPNEQAQTFTVGITGFLTQVDLAVANRFLGSADLLFDVRPTTLAGVPLENNGSALVNLTVSPADLPTFTTFPISFYSFVVAGIPVTDGDVLALVLRASAPPPGVFLVAGQSVAVDPYSRGRAYGRTETIAGFGPWRQYDGPVMGQMRFVDFAFRTYVDTDPIPEPATLVLVGTGVLALVRRRMRQPDEGRRALARRFSRTSA